MKSFLWLLAGAAGALAYVLIKRPLPAASGTAAPVEDLAHKLQDAWADHHTVV